MYQLSAKKHPNFLERSLTRKEKQPRRNTQEMLTHVLVQSCGSTLALLCLLIGAVPTLALFASAVSVATYTYALPTFLWFWLVLACVHFEIHRTYAKDPIFKVQRVSYDEGWHAVNGLCVLLYLHTFSYPNRFVIFLTMYLFNESMVLFCLLQKHKATWWLFHIIYYCGAFQTFLFITLSNPLTEWSLFRVIGHLVSLATYMGVVWVTTWDNMYGKLTWKMNIAGCAFLSEFFVLFWLHSSPSLTSFYGHA